MSKKIISLVAMVMALAIPMTAQARTVKYTYVASPGTALTTGVDYHRGSPAVEVHVHPLGGFSFTPSGTTFTVKVDDFGVEDGLDIYLSVCQENDVDAVNGDTNSCGESGTDDHSFTAGCTPVRVSRSFSGAVAREPVAVFVYNSLALCEGIMTAGEVTVTGVQ